MRCLIVWELVQLARQQRTFMLRGAYACVLGLAVFVAAPRNGDAGSTIARVRAEAKVADDFFHLFAFLQLAVVVAVTPAYAALAIAGEKERGTLLFLLVAPLNDAEIILAKWIARSIHALVLVVAGFGFVGVMQLFGGFAGASLVASTALTVSTALAAAAAALLASVVTQRSTPAIAAAFILATLVLFGIPQLPLFAAEMFLLVQGDAARTPPAVFAQLAALQPFHAMSELQQGGLMAGCWRVALWHGAACALCLSIAVWRLRPAATRELRGRAHRPFRRAARSLGATPPVVWKERWFAGGNPRTEQIAGFAWGVFIVVAPTTDFLIFGFSRQSAQVYRDVLPGPVALVFLSAPIVVLARGALSVTKEKQQDTWDLLLSTPLSAAEILHGKRRGAVDGPLAWGLVVLCTLYGIATFAGVGNFWEWLLVLGLFAAWIDLLACVSVICSLMAKTSRNAVSWAIVHYLFTAPILGSCLGPLLLEAPKPSLRLAVVLYTLIIGTFVLGRAVFVRAVADFGEHTGRMERRTVWEA